MKQTVGVLIVIGYLAFIIVSLIAVGVGNFRRELKEYRERRGEQKAD